MNVFYSLLKTKRINAITPTYAIAFVAEGEGYLRSRDLKLQKPKIITYKRVTSI